MNFGMITSNQNSKTKQNYAIWILLALLIILKLEILKDSNDVERQFDTSNYGENDKGLLPIGKNKTLIGLFKDKLGGKTMKEFIGLRPKTYAYLMDDDSEHKKAKGTEKCVIKRELIFKDYKDYL